MSGAAFGTGLRCLLILHDRFLVLFCCKHYGEKFITLVPAGNMTPLGGKIAFVRHAIQQDIENSRSIVHQFP